MSYSVYIHTNLINDKRYVGITKRNPPCLRWGKFGEHYANKEFRADIGKYGWDKFDHQIVARNLTAAQASSQEQFWVALFNTTDPRFGYNLTKGGFGCTASKRIAEKISNALKGKPHKGHPIDAATRAKISAANKGRTRSDDTRRRMSQARKGVKPSEETRQRMSASHLKRSLEGRNLGGSGFLWYHDQTTNYFIRPSDERVSEQGLIPGRLSWKKSS